MGTSKVSSTCNEIKTTLQNLKSALYQLFVKIISSKRTMNCNKYNVDQTSE